jgi:hypothetical protein
MCHEKPTGRSGARERRRTGKSSKRLASPDAHSPGRLVSSRGMGPTWRMRFADLVIFRLLDRKSGMRK